MEKLNKKGSFEVINKGMIAFIGFIFIALLAILLISVSSQTAIVCQGTSVGDTCLDCQTGFEYSNRSDCCNSTGGTADCLGANLTSPIGYTGDAYNATKDLMSAAILPPQFAQIIVIVIIIVGILAMLAFVGYGAYGKLRR